MHELGTHTGARGHRRGGSAGQLCANPAGSACAAPLRARRTVRRPKSVDEQAINWIQAGIQQRRAHATVLWADMPLHSDVYWSRTSDEVPAWDFPPIVKAAM